MTQPISNIPADAHLPRQLRRQQIDELLALAEYLPKDDRVLVEHVLVQGMPVARIARLYQRPSRQLRRHVSSIFNRMTNKLFKYVAIRMDTLPVDARPTAKYVVLHGMSLRQAARAAGTSLHQVRKHMNTVHATARLLA